MVSQPTVNQASPTRLKSIKALPTKARSIASVESETKNEDPIIKARVDADTVRKMLKNKAKRQAQATQENFLQEWTDWSYRTKNPAFVAAFEKFRTKAIFHDLVIAYNKTPAGLRNPQKVPPYPERINAPDISTILAPGAEEGDDLSKSSSSNYMIGVFFTKDAQEWSGGEKEVKQEILKRLAPIANEIQSGLNLFEVRVEVLGNIRYQNVSEAVTTALLHYNVVYIYDGKRQRQFTKYIP